MASLFPERRGGLLLLAACLLCLQPVLAAKVQTPRLDRQTPLDVKGDDSEYDMNLGTLRARDVTITQGPGLTIHATRANGRGLKEGYRDSTWDLSEGIHIELDNAVLDADTATVVFANERVISIRVQGKPARFSHQQASVRRDGRASNIAYDARSGDLRLSGGTWLSDGRSEYRSSVLLYNTNTGKITNDARSGDSGPAHIVILPGKAPEIPTPRTPDRDTAQ